MFYVKSNHLYAIECWTMFSKKKRLQTTDIWLFIRMLKKNTPIGTCEYQGSLKKRTAVFMIRNI